MRQPIVSRVILVFLASLLASSCRNPDSRHESERRQIVLSASQVHDGWYFAAGDQIIIDGTINGDAYLAAGTVDMNGSINGDLIIAGGQLNIGGTVSDDIRGAGGVVRLSGRTGKNVTVAGGSIVVTREAEVGKNLLAAGGDISIRGTVGQEAKLAGGNATITGTIKGNLGAAVGQMTVHEGATIGGDLAVMTEDSTHIKIAQGAVRGKTQISIEGAKASRHFLGMTGGAIWFKALFLLSLIATALVLAFLAPTQLAETGLTIRERPGASALWGFLVLVLAPVVTIILFITIIGVPLGLFLLFLYLWYMYLSQLALGAAVGHMILGINAKHGWRLFGAIALGIVIVQLLTFIPYVKILVIIAGYIFGMGALSIITKDELESHRTH